jgi:hypothetical protein
MARDMYLVTSDGHAPRYTRNIVVAGSAPRVLDKAGERIVPEEPLQRVQL